MTNNYKDIASQIFECSKDSLEQFNELIDPFNHENKITGVIRRSSKTKYGSMIFFEINGELQDPKIIFGTPKLIYPFDREMNFAWPVVEKLQAYEKLDGTNILSYTYIFKNKTYNSFKLRLFPFLRESKFGNFLNMWKEYLKENNWINCVIENNPNYNLSFELFGSRNFITIKYPFPIEVNLLFGVNKLTSEICPISELKINEKVKIPKKYISNKSDLTELYKNFREEMSEKNKDELLQEGIVIYIKPKNLNNWVMYKCKPKEIEDIHWTSDYINKYSIYNTCINAFESYENPTIENIIELLLEETSKEKIDKNIDCIKYSLIKAKEYMNLKKMANEAWEEAKSQGLDITKDKNETMRFISKYFKKEDMRKVGGVVLKQAGLLKDRKENKNE